MRKEALEQLNIKEVNVLVPDRKLTTEEMVLVGLESNVQSGEWDWKELSSWNDKELLLNAGFTESELMINFGLDNADQQDVDLERLQVLEVLPPESVRLKERAAIHFNSIDEYKSVKEAILSGKITSKDLVKLL